MLRLLITQASDRKILKGAFEDIRDEDDIEIYRKLITECLNIGIEVNFYTIMKPAKRIKRPHVMRNQHDVNMAYRA